MLGTESRLAKYKANALSLWPLVLSLKKQGCKKQVACFYKTLI